MPSHDIKHQARLWRESKAKEKSKYQPFRAEMQCVSLACTHEQIVFHIQDMGNDDNSLVNEFSCVISD